LALRGTIQNAAALTHPRPLKRLAKLVKRTLPPALASGLEYWGWGLGLVFGYLPRERASIMSTADNNPQLQPVERRAAWRSSLYDEPLWVSIAWILVPVVLGALTIFLAIR
jgi:hypothetical protein